MKLYLLQPIEDWDSWYDKSFGHIVRSENEQSARLLASSAHGDEGPQVWMDSEKTTCKELITDGPSEHILRDFASA